MQFILPIRDQENQLEQILANTEAFLSYLNREIRDVIAGLDESSPSDKDLLLVDDGSQDSTKAMAEYYIDGRDVGLISHERPMGYGYVFADALKYSNDMGQSIMVLLNGEALLNDKMFSYMSGLVAALAEGDMIFGDFRSSVRSESAIQYMTQNKPEEVFVPFDLDGLWAQDQFQALRAQFQDGIGSDMPDFFSGFQAFWLKGLEDMVVDEEGYLSLLQLYVQGVARGQTIENYFLPGVMIAPERFDYELGDLDDWLSKLEHVIRREILLFQADS